MDDISGPECAPTPLGKKFSDPFITADGSPRAQVELSGVKTLWFNTGTLCNITCQNCYIESSPQNDRLVYIGADEVKEYLHQIKLRNWPVEEIGITGGEPFMNPEIIQIMRACLDEGYKLLVLTNAMRPMMRPKMQAGIKALEEKFPNQMTLRVSLDHWEAEYHQLERGQGSFERAIEGMQWLSEHGIKLNVAGRNMWSEEDAKARDGYHALYTRFGFEIDAYCPQETMIFPEIDPKAEVPEITTKCWDILGKKPSDIMCASSRMVVKRKGAARPTVLACTLLAYEA